MAVVETLARTPGFQRLRDELIELAQLQPGDRVLDVGAGSGLLALAAAPAVAEVTAIDGSASICAALQSRVDASRIRNVHVRVADATALPLADGSVDVALSNYCLHHLSNDRKLLALSEIRRVLTPGGRLVLGDMMFEIGVRTTRDRAIVIRFALRQLRRGPAGFVRLAKNAGRLLGGRSEHPASVDWWADALRRAGFTDIRTWALAHEGGIATARRPSADRHATESSR